MINRILPLLNSLIPTGLAFKGLQKLDPRIGKFLTGAAAAGYGTDTILDFLRDKFQPQSNKNSEQNMAQNVGKNRLRPDEEAAYQQIQNSKQVPKLVANAAAAGIGGAAGLGIGSLMNGAESQDQSVLSGPSTAKSPFDILSQYSPDLAKFFQEQIQQGQPPQAAAAIAKTSTPFGALIKKIEKDTKVNFVDFINQLFGNQSQQSNQTQQQNNPQQQQQGNVDQALMAALQKILQM